MAKDSQELDGKQRQAVFCLARLGWRSKHGRLD
jgi:hypothetical protein